MDLNIFEDKIFTSRRFIRKKISEFYPTTLCFACSNQFGDEKAGSESAKATHFNLLFKSVYNKNELPLLIYRKSKLKLIKTAQLEIEEFSQNLDMSKSTGPDNLASIILKNFSRTLSKSLLLLFQTILN